MRDSVLSPLSFKAPCTCPSNLPVCVTVQCVNENVPSPVAICRLGIPSPPSHSQHLHVYVCVCVCVDTCWLFCPTQQQIDFRLCCFMNSSFHFNSSVDETKRSQFPQEQVAHGNDNITGAHCFASFSSMPAVIMWKQQVAKIHKCLNVKSILLILYNYSLPLYGEE